MMGTMPDLFSAIRKLDGEVNNKIINLKQFAQTVSQVPRMSAAKNKWIIDLVRTVS